MVSLLSLRKPSTQSRWPVFLLLPLLIFFLRPSKQQPSTLRTLPEEISSKCPSTHPLIVFLHLHKTGGNTLKKALFAFTKKNHLRLHHTCHPSTPDPPFQRWYFAREKHATGIDCNLDNLRGAPENLDIIVGHQYLGVHTLFPNREVRYFTFVREPLRRKVAHFMHFEKGSDVHLFTYLVEQNRNYMTKRLASNMVSSEIMTDLQSRFMDLEIFASRAALRAAKRHLVERFFFIGLQERFEASVCVLSKILNTACGAEGKLARQWQLDTAKVLRMSENVRGGTAERLKRVPPSVRQAAKRAEAADVELYKFAKELFGRKLDLYPECRR